MSFRVLVIPEDPTYNGYILKPLVEHLLEEVGRAQPRVQVLSDPKVGGYDQAVEVLNGQALRDKYGHYDLWLFLPDADRCPDPTKLERSIQGMGIPFFVCPAVPEVEIWLLAGYRNELRVTWQQARQHPRLKEDVFEPFLRSAGNPAAAGGGRQLLMGGTLNNFRGLLEICPELRDLRTKIASLLSRAQR